MEQCIDCGAEDAPLGSLYCEDCGYDDQMLIECSSCGREFDPTVEDDSEYDTCGACMSDFADA